MKITGTSCVRVARPEMPADLVAIHLRQADVQQDEIGRVALDGLKRLPSVGDGAHVVPLLAQQVRQEPQGVDRVVDDQHAGRVGFTIHPMVPDIRSVRHYTPETWRRRSLDDRVASQKIHKSVWDNS